MAVSRVIKVLISSVNLEVATEVHTHNIALIKVIYGLKVVVPTLAMLCLHVQTLLVHVYYFSLFPYILLCHRLFWNLNVFHSYLRAISGVILCCRLDEAGL